MYSDLWEKFPSSFQIHSTATITEEIIGKREFLALARNFMYSWNKIWQKQNNLQEFLNILYFKEHSSHFQTQCIYCAVFI